MGLTYAAVGLANARRPDLFPIEVQALADTGALHLCIPAHIALQLDLQELERREVTLADGSKHLVPYVGPLLVAVANRRGFGGAMVFGDEVLLGAIPMEDLTRQVMPNPANPNIPGSVAKPTQV